MFSSLAARETYVAETNFAARKQKLFLPEVKKHVSQFSHDENNVDWVPMSLAQ